jgi:hypothetical protein
MGILAAIVWQDIRSRLVLWTLFPALAAGLCLVHVLRTGSVNLLWFPLVCNMVLVIMMLLAVSLYVWITRKKFINIIDSLLGWADILFLVAIAFYFSVPNFLVFWIASMSFALLAWIIWQALAERKSKHIPLVGLQSIALVLFLSADWWLHLVNLTDDTWLLNLVSKWN